MLNEEWVMALKCYECTHQEAVEATKQIYNRILASPAQCDNINFCQGKWCFQRLDGSNITFGCADYAYPLGDVLIDRDGVSEPIDTQCRALFSGPNAQIYHATCFCKTEDLCNSAPRNFKKNFHNTFIFKLIALLLIISNRLMFKIT